MKIKNWILGYLMSIFLLGTLFIFPALSLAANECPSQGAASPPSTAVCNPAPNFFIDLMGMGANSHPNTFQGIFQFIIQILLGIVGLLAVLFIIIGGFQYVTSAGNDEQAEAGKKTLTNAIIGLAIVILSYVIVVVVINALNGKVT